jgi:small subunit ribosomal protein S13
LADEKKEKADAKDKAKESTKDKVTEPKKDKVKESKKDKEHDDDFKYIVRIANSDIDGNKPVVNALTAIKGVGDRVAEIIMNKTQLPRNEKIGNLPDEDIEELAKHVLDFAIETPGWLLNQQRDVWTGEDIHIFGSEMDMRRQDDINTLKKIRCYRGIRHEKGQKVRGQRTKAHGRSGLTVGVVKKAQKSK